MKVILTRKNIEIFVDDEDYEFLNQFTWSIHRGRKTYYAVTGISKTRKTISLHKLLIQTNKFIDHIDGNGLNNQKSNLRMCSNAENCRNADKSKNNKSGYKGVNYLSRLKDKPYKARLMVDYKEIHLGYFKTAKEAAIAYNNASLKYFGKFAKLNNIEE